MKRRVIAVLAGLFTVVMAVGPVAAAPVPPDIGLLTGTAEVGKFGTCGNDGRGNVAGPGLGLPFFHGKKNAWWVLNAPGSLSSLVHGAGDLHLCGKLGEVAGRLGGGLGAACGMSKGWDGRGTVLYADGVSVHLTDLEWKASAGPNFVVFGDVHESKGSKLGGQVVAILNVFPAAGEEFDCFGKPFFIGGESDPHTKTGGATLFDVTGVFTVFPTQTPLFDWNFPTITCKDDSGMFCLYGPKKEPPPKS